MYSGIWATGAILSALLSSSTAQLSTKCNPTVNGKSGLCKLARGTSLTPSIATCPTDVGLTDSPFSTDFTKGTAANWTAAIGTNLVYGTNGAEFIIKAETDAPTLTTDFYIFFGYVEVKMRAANGTGIVSSIVLASDDLDEIDWVGRHEW